MSAVRMVAFGVLELKHRDANNLYFGSKEERERELEGDRQRDELRKLVNDELRKYGLLLTRNVVTHGQKWRTKANTFVLYGQKKGPTGFVTRIELRVGNFKDCCERAVELLDAMEQDNKII